MITAVDPTSSLPDLSQCDVEPIHIPGSIQPHGVLLALNGPELRITQVSSTSLTLLGVAPAVLLDRKLATALGPALADAVREALTRYQELPDAPASFDWQPPDSDLVFSGCVHQSDQLVVLELEPTTATAPALNKARTQAIRGLSMVRAQAELSAKVQTAAEWLRRLTGYDRVMIYRFDEHSHGEVVAEALRADLEPFLGLHYPATDIPAQARRMFLVSPTRVIVDVDYTPSPLLPAVNPVSGRPLDLSRSLLCSVSLVHLEYLRNMGARATLVAPLLREGRLWGLISCQHCAPHPVPSEIREVVAWIAQDLGTQISLAEEIHSRRYEAFLKQCRNNIIVAMRRGTRLSALLSGPAQADILGAVGAEGAALVRGGQVTTAGVTPEPQRVLEIAEGLSPLRANDPFLLLATDCLSEHLPGTADLAATAAGVVLFPLDAEQTIKLVWFRGEQLHHVTWGGNPDKAMVMAPGGRLGSRQSFAAWSQIVRLRSKHWHTEELESARELGAMIDIEWRRIAEDALRANEALLTNLLDSLTAQIAVLDGQGVITLVNRAWRRFAEEHGGDADGQLGVNYLKACHSLPSDQYALEAHNALSGIRDVLGGVLDHFTMEYPCHSPVTQRWFVMHVSPLSGAHRGGVVAHEEITAQKQAELLRRASEEKYSALFQMLPEGVLITDPNGKIVDTNPASERIFGLTRAQQLERHVGGPEWTIVWPNGTPVAKEDLVSIRALREQSAIKDEEVGVVRPDGTVCWLLVASAPIPVAGYGVAVVLRDITERKAAVEALARLNAHLEERVLFIQSRQAAMGEMIGNIAHQWRQPLNALAMILANIHDLYEFQELSAETLEQALADGQRLLQKMSSTITDFRDFFRPTKEPVRFSARKQIRQAMLLVEASFKSKSFAIQLDAPEDVTLFGFPNEYSQVLLNVLTNAKDAMEERGLGAGTVQIQLRAEYGYGVVSVSDMGGGVPPAIMDKIFDPYFSTKAMGTGIGLYMSKMIIERNMQGSIDVHNTDTGAEFTIFSPLANLAKV